MRMTFDQIKVGMRFVSVIDKVEVGRKFRVTRKVKKPFKTVFMSTRDDAGPVELDFKMFEINRCLRPYTDEEKSDDGTDSYFVTFPDGGKQKMDRQKLLFVLPELDRIFDHFKIKVIEHLEFTTEDNKRIRIVGEIR